MNRFPENIVCKTSEISDGNMSFRFGDVKEVVSNRKKFLKKLNIPVNRYIPMTCSHGDTITTVNRSNLRIMAESEEEMIEAEVLMTQEKGLVLMALTADCQPVSFYDPKTSTIALAHCSRQTIADGLVQKICDFLHHEFNTNTTDLLVHIGPHIKKESYAFPLHLDHVSPKIAPFITEKDGLAYIDILAANVHQLIEIGMSKENIEVSDVDTVTSKNHFSYYRAKRTEDDLKGRMATILMME